MYYLPHYHTVIDRARAEKMQEPEPVSFIRLKLYQNITWADSISDLYQNHRKRAKLSWHHNIKLSFWSLSFCLFVTLIKCHHPGLEKHWLVGVRTSSAPFVLRGWYQRRGKRRAEGLFFIVCFPYIYRCRRLSCWPPMPMPWALSPPQPARSRVFTWTWTDRYCRHRGLWD